METLNKELSVLQQTACNVNRLGQNERKKTHLITLTDDQGMLDLSNGFIVWVLCLSSGERLPFSYQTCSIFHFFLST